MLLNEDFNPDDFTIVARPPGDGELAELVSVYRAGLRDGLKHWPTLTIEFDEATWPLFAEIRYSLTTDPLPGVTVSAVTIASPRLTLARKGVH